MKVIKISNDAGQINPYHEIKISVKCHLHPDEEVAFICGDDIRLLNQVSERYVALLNNISKILTRVK